MFPYNKLFKDAGQSTLKLFNMQSRAACKSRLSVKVGMNNDIRNLRLLGNGRRGRRRPRVFRRRENFYNYYHDDEFQLKFRFSKATVRYIVDLVRHEIEPRTNRSCSITATQQIFATLRYYATGSFQIVAGELTGISQSSVSKIVFRVSRSLSHLK